MLATDIASNNASTFMAFLTDLEFKVATYLGIHLIMDNGSSHTAKATKARLDERPRFVS